MMMNLRLHLALAIMMTRVCSTHHCTDLKCSKSELNSNIFVNVQLPTYIRMQIDKMHLFIFIIVLHVNILNIILSKSSN